MFDLQKKYKSIRDKSGFTQREIEEAAGISFGEISRFEKGKSNPSLSQLVRMLAPLDSTLQIEENLKEKDDKEPVKIPIKSIEFAEVDKDSRANMFSKSDLLDIFYNIKVTVKDPSITLQFVERLIESDLDFSEENMKNKCLKIELEADTDIYDDFVQLFYNSISSLSYTEDTDTGWAFYNYIQKSALSEGCIKLYFSDAALGGDFKNILIKMKKKLQKKVESIKTFIKANPEGFTYACYNAYDFEEFDLETIIEDRGELPTCVNIKAWSPADAKKKYILSNKVSLKELYLIDGFLKDIAIEIYYSDDVIDFLSGYKSNKKMKSYFHEIFLKYDISCDINDKHFFNEFYEGFEQCYEPEEIYEIFGPANFERLFNMNIEEKILVSMEAESQRILNKLY